MDGHVADRTRSRDGRPTQLLVRTDWRGELRFRERGELRRRGHRPDLVGRLPDGQLLPIEVELTDKSSARLKAVLELHGEWISVGKSAAVIYVCGDQEIGHKTLALSSENYRGTSLAAIGVAAHEAGHALQHREGYQMLEFRMALAPTTRIAAGIIPFIYIGSIFLTGGLSGMILNVAILIFAVLTLFQLITLPVEYDASRRAKAQLVSLGILDRDEMPGVNQTLNAAALTYLAAFMSALLNLLSLLSRRN